MPIILLLFAACIPKNTPQNTSQAVQKSVNELYAQFVGDDACQKCHQAEFFSHSKTHHKQTLHEATMTALGDLAPSVGEVSAGIAFGVEQERFFVSASVPSSGEKVQRKVPLSLVLGSGKTGMTFLAFLSQGVRQNIGSAEINQSYFPQQKAWHTTPGQQGFHAGRAGRTYSEEGTRHCLNCHVVTLPLNNIVPEKRFFGVGCESCHGAGSRHISLMQQASLTKVKPTTMGLFHFTGAGGKEINTLCGRCHRTAADVATLGPNDQQSTNRFQPFGLSLSKCFIQSNNALTCITCHNPHEDAKTDSKSYEPACLSCHSGKSADKKACPVNPKEKCIGCHMPTRPVFPGSPLPNAMADHFIRVYKKLK
jgi:hypothetical protein